MAIPPVELLSNRPGGGIVASMQGINALHKSNLDNAIKNVELEYAPFNKYADAASKMAYSQFVGPQSIANILTNPTTRGMFNKEQYDQLAKAFSQQVSTSNSLANMPVPKPGQNRNYGMGLGSRILPFINSLLGMNKQSGMGNPFAGHQPIGQSQIAPQAPSNVNSGYEYDANGNNVIGNPADVKNPNDSSTIPAQLPPGSSQPALNGTSPAYSRASKLIPKGQMGASNPPAVMQAGEAGLKTQTEAEAKAITNQWQARQDDIREQVAGAQEMERQLDRMSEARSELRDYEKGFGLGNLPAVSDAAQVMDTAAANVVAARLRAWQSSRITNMDIGFGQMLKPGRWMNDKSYNNEVAYEKGLSQRLQEYQPFSVMAQEAGLTPAQADTVWARYANERPFYDNKNKNIMYDNLNSWEKYLSPQSMKETFSPQFKKEMDHYRKNMAGGDKKSDKEVIGSYESGKKTTEKENQEMWDVYDPQGKLVATGATKNVDRFLKDHRGYTRKKQ